ncbi:MAG: GNAT family N-acetyltransferase [Bacillota bacterium]|nr:GNAT family N-acetyltransferase [Bacillota bacterium]
MYSIIRREEAFRRLTIEEIPAAVSLIWDVFCRFNASDCTDEGIEEFRNAAESSKSDSSVIFYGAFENGELVGALGLRLPRHISFFFVKSDRHGRGYGRNLFEAVRKEHGGDEYTVNSSLYAENYYRRLGFETLDTEQTANGIRFVPMKYYRNGSG